MPLFSNVDRISSTYGAHLSAFRKLYEFHSLRSGSASDFLQLAPKLGSSEGFRLDFSDLVRTIRDREQGRLSAAEMLTIAGFAIGGPGIAGAEMELYQAAGTVQVLLAGVGGWQEAGQQWSRRADGVGEDTVLEISAARQTGGRDEVGLSVADHGDEDLAGGDLGWERSQVEGDAGVGGDVSPEMKQTLARLEMASLQLKVYLDDIDRRMERIEPHLDDLTTMVQSSADHFQRRGRETGRQELWVEGPELGDGEPRQRREDGEPRPELAAAPQVRRRRSEEAIAAAMEMSRGERHGFGSRPEEALPIAGRESGISEQGAWQGLEPIAPKEEVDVSSLAPIGLEARAPQPDVEAELTAMHGADAEDGGAGGEDGEELSFRSLGGPVRWPVPVEVTAPFAVHEVIEAAGEVGEPFAAEGAGDGIPRAPKIAAGEIELAGRRGAGLRRQLPPVQRAWPELQRAPEQREVDDRIARPADAIATKRSAWSWGATAASLVVAAGMVAFFGPWHLPGRRAAAAETATGSAAKSASATELGTTADKTPTDQNGAAGQNGVAGEPLPMAAEPRAPSSGGGSAERDNGVRRTVEGATTPRSLVASPPRVHQSRAAEEPRVAAAASATPPKPASGMEPGPTVAAVAANSAGAVKKDDTSSQGESTNDRVAGARAADAPRPVRVENLHPEDATERTAGVGGGGATHLETASTTAKESAPVATGSAAVPGPAGASGASVSSAASGAAAPTRTAGAGGTTVAAADVPRMPAGRNELVPTTGGTVLSAPAPIYPQQAMQMNVQGAVVIRATVDKTGKVTSMQVVNGPMPLQQSAKEAVGRRRYKPFLLHGSPTEFQTLVTLNYKLAK